MDMQAAISKAARLLRLAKSDNPHEAALAAARAQEIIDRYRLTGADLELDGKKVESDEPIRDFEAPLEEGAARLETWRTRLSSVVARANQCRTYLMGPTIRLVGRPSDAEAVRYLYAFLVKEIERLTARDAKGNGRTWANNYRLGAVQEIGARLNEQRKATTEAVKSEATNPHALVLVQQAIVRIEEKAKATEVWMDANLNLGRGRSAKSTYHSGAREAGRRAAKEIKLGGGAGLAAGHKALGGGAA